MFHSSLLGTERQKNGVPQCRMTACHSVYKGDLLWTKATADFCRDTRYYCYHIKVYEIPGDNGEKRLRYTLRVLSVIWFCVKRIEENLGFVTQTSRDRAMGLDESLISKTDDERHHSEKKKERIKK